MKKLVFTLQFIVLIYALTAFSSKIDALNISEKIDENKQDTVMQGTILKKEWTKQEIMSLFLRNSDVNWRVIDCVTVPDFAFDRVGIILFVDNEEQTTNVAFMDENGYYQRCGVYSKLCSESELTYCNNGAVTFKLQTDDGIEYTHKFTISTEDIKVHFISEDNLKEVMADK